jgi:hypothetical protein
MFVGDEILPYHLAISERWKVHHASTSMGNHAWMQAEEREFLVRPQVAFCPRAYAALRNIQSRIGLDYFGIDCGVDHDDEADVPGLRSSAPARTRRRLQLLARW